MTVFCLIICRLESDPPSSDCLIIVLRTYEPELYTKIYRRIGVTAESYSSMLLFGLYYSHFLSVRKKSCV